MSKRKRTQGRQNQEKPSELQNIEWLNHRTGYPSPEEREKIIELRKKLLGEVIILFARRTPLTDSRLAQFAERYGKDEFDRTLDTVSKSFQNAPSIAADDARAYREYRQRFSRFGGNLPFLSMKETDEWLDKNYQTASEPGIFPRGDNEATKILLMDWRLWDDITPPAIPPRPADYSAPVPASYPEALSHLLDYGNNLDQDYDLTAERIALYKKNVPALTRMALDKGFLHGWPSENASWTNWHATHILGLIGAWDSAYALTTLVDEENDWLSDHLPHIWADMGLGTEPILWTILENPSASVKARGLAAEGLSTMAEDNEAIEDKVIQGFGKILQNEKTFNAEVNAYLVWILRDMEAIEDVYDIVENAFDNERVDKTIISADSVFEEDDWDEDYDDEDFDEDDVEDGRQNPD